MRMRLSFLLSVLFHGVVLALPLFPFGVDNHEEPIPVVLLSSVDGPEQPAAGNASGIGTGSARPAVSKGMGKRTDSENRNTFPLRKMIQAAGLAGEGAHNDSQASDSGMEAMSVGTISLVPYAASSEGSGKGPAAVFTDGFLEGVGGGGDQAGDPEPGGGPAPFSPVHYAHHPKPDYPERARREGWEGTVLLRVLVDQKGRPKWVELNRSSGFEILDRAAIETVKGWRFRPARSGVNAVESWVKVPIMFRLTEMKNER